MKKDSSKLLKGLEQDAKIRYMRAALDEAEKGVGHTRPNPPVGAVVVKNGRIIGRGYHARCGGNHAEVAALKSCRVSPKGATVYVTLEPCSKPGRVGACTDALIAAGVKRVEWLMADPNPKNRNRAKRVLSAAGIEAYNWDSRGQNDFECIEMISDAHTMLLPFIKAMQTGLPFVTVKLAMSLDGKICDNKGNARWISDDEARKYTDAFRAEADCILVGAETIRRDNPSLLCHTRDNPDLYRVVITRSGNFPKDAQIFTDEAKDRTIVLRLKGSETLRDAMMMLVAKGFHNVLCEGGLNLARGLADEGLVDRWMNVMCPIVIGSRPIEKALNFKTVFQLREDTPPLTHDAILFAQTPRISKEAH